MEIGARDAREEKGKEGFGEVKEKKGKGNLPQRGRKIGEWPNPRVDPGGGYREALFYQWEGSKIKQVISSWRRGRRRKGRCEKWSGWREHS